MYGKVFKQIYKGTLAMVGPWEALVTFQQFIVLADKAGEVDMTADAISRETTIPLKIITKGIEALEAPDPESRSPDEDGRRIIRLSEGRSWGWRIVNYEHYRTIQSDEERKEYHARYYQTKVKPKLEAARGKGSRRFQDIQQVSSDSRQVEVEVEVDVNNRASGAQCAKDFERWWLTYPKKAKKKTAKATWMIKKPDADLLIADVENRLANDDQWKRGYIPHPTTYLNGERWNDEIATEHKPPRELTYAENLAKDLKERRDANRQ